MVDGISVTSNRDAAPTPRRWLELRAARASTEESTTTGASSESAASGSAWRMELEAECAKAADAGEPAAAQQAAEEAEATEAAAETAVTEAEETEEAGDLLFGPDSWLENPTELLPDGSAVSLNPVWFATQETAEKLAEMLGGVAVQQNEFTGDSSRIMQQQPNWMVEMPNGTRLNAGVTAWLYTTSYPRSYIDSVVAEWAAGPAV